jgi:hypothetical protein
MGEDQVSDNSNKIAAWVIGVPLALTAGFGVWTNVYPDIHRAMDARNACEQRIRISTGTHTAPRIGRVSPASEDNHYLVMRWTPEDLQLTGKLGELIGQSAICAFNTRTREVDKFAMF